MKCPACEEHFDIEDWQDDSPFECPNCETLLRLDIDEGTYLGATHSSLVIMEDEE